MSNRYLIADRENKLSASIPLSSTQKKLDATLVELAKQGDKIAFRELYQQHHQRVYALCFRLAGQKELAEEATQDTFVRVWQKLPQFKGESQFTTWLHSLTVNQALNCINKHKRFWDRFLPEQLHADSGASVIDYDGLDKLIIRLPERARIIFVLYALEGYQHDEIAKRLNIASGTSKAQYHRAKKLLQEMI